MEKYVLVEFPDNSLFFEENGIGYPCCDAEDNGARYVTEKDYVEHFKRQPEKSQYYTIVQWPESQELMEKTDFEECSEAVMDEKGLKDFICPAFWVPTSQC